MLYFDNNATTQAAPEVVEYMRPFFSDVYANPSALYNAGLKARAAVEEARGKAADFFNCLPQEIYFTSGGTESDNLAILGAAAAQPQKRHVITSSIEHPAVMSCAGLLEKMGYSVTYLPADSEGIVNLNTLKKSLTKETLLVSLMYANNETGVIQPVDEAAALCRMDGVLFHTDAVNAAGKLNIDVRKSGFDMLSAAAHKFHGPKGIGILYVKNGVRLEPLIQGSKQERGLRPGTENVPLIAGMGKAFELASEFLNDKGRFKEAVGNLKYIEKEIFGNIKGVKLNGSADKRLWNTLNVRFDGIEAESLVINLDLAGAAVSGGSACASGSIAPSHVLSAMGLTEKESRSSIRISTGRYTTREECVKFCGLLKTASEKLRAVSAL